jgi:hypothetical protein
MLAGGDPDIAAEQVMHQLPGAVLAPLLKVMVDDPPRGQIMGQHAPGTATAQQIEDAVEDLALGVFFRSAPGFRLGHEMFNQVPFFIAEIGRIR